MKCHALKMCALKVGISLLFVGTMAITTLAGQSAFAAPCAGLGTTFDTTCSVHLSTYFPAGALAFSSDANATMPTNGSIAGTNLFQFDTTVFDDRGSASGWKMQAASTGLVSPATGSPAIPLSLTGITPGTASGASCGNTGPSFDGTVTTPLTATASTYVRLTPSNTTAFHCSDPFTSLGSYIISAGSPAGTYQGDITLTLVNTATGA
ncbi:hypothetical protein [Dictyobacter arantiisoli]|uniref:WxL domain-containing protein n=1 Tax=Dictyobacter arantiisoli TaxID=2014874 RepID=A0A5A5TEF4_9CHLR|nr:hypothetical protein [Dictyobacter arantiisoli]GCF09526.1 hypothetical protein KDI_30900 [Dictyobacter arantiisoli]